MLAHARAPQLRLVESLPTVAGDAAEGDLARALVAGDERAAELAWDRYGPLVHKIAVRTLGRDDVDDVTQEIFHRIFLRIGTLRKPESLRAFVVSFAIRTVRSELRRRRARRWLSLTDTGQIPERPAAVRNAEVCYELLFLWRLLDELSVRDRLVLILRHVEGMKLQEIAEDLELSLSTVKRVLRRASHRLSIRLGHKGKRRKRRRRSRGGTPSRTVVLRRFRPVER